MPSKNKREWTDEELEDISNLYKKGWTNGAIAEKYNCHWTTIDRLTRKKIEKDESDYIFKKIYGEFPTLNEKKQFKKYY